MITVLHNPHHASLQSSTQNIQPAAPLRAGDGSKLTTPAHVTPAHVTPASDDVFSSARPRRSLHAQDVPDGSSRNSKNDSAPMRGGSDDHLDAAKQRKELDGEIRSLDTYPAERDKITRELDGAITTTRAALEQIDHHWNPRTLSKMEALFGGDVKSGAVRAAIRSRLENALSGLGQARANKGKDIFIQDPGIANSLAYAGKEPSGHTGQVVFSKLALAVVDDARIQKTLIHEAMHFASKLTDHWYVKIDENGDFYRKAPSFFKGSLPPLTSGQALDNADSLAYAAVVLAANQGSYHDDL